MPATRAVPLLPDLAAAQPAASLARDPSRSATTTSSTPSDSVRSRTVQRPIAPAPPTTTTRMPSDLPGLEPQAVSRASPRVVPARPVPGYAVVRFGAEGGPWPPPLPTCWPSTSSAWGWSRARAGWTGRSAGRTCPSSRTRPGSCAAGRCCSPPASACAAAPRARPPTSSSWPGPSWPPSASGSGSPSRPPRRPCSRPPTGPASRCSRCRSRCRSSPSPRRCSRAWSTSSTCCSSGPGRSSRRCRGCWSRGPASTPCWRRTPG